MKTRKVKRVGPWSVSIIMQSMSRISDVALFTIIAPWLIKIPPPPMKCESILLSHRDGPKFKEKKIENSLKAF